MNDKSMITPLAFPADRKRITKPTLNSLSVELSGGGRAAAKQRRPWPWPEPRRAPMADEHVRLTTVAPSQAGDASLPSA